jgi:hypothetical protein
MPASPVAHEELELRLSRLHMHMQKNVSTCREREKAAMAAKVAAASPSSSPGPRRPRRPTLPTTSEESDSSDLRERLRPVFDRFDADGSGAISTSEMGAVCKAMQVEMTGAQMATMMSEADPDGRYDRVACAHSQVTPRLLPGPMNLRVASVSSRVVWPNVFSCALPCASRQWGDRLRGVPRRYA